MGLIILFQRVCLHGTGLIHHVYFPGNKILIIIVTIINVDLYSSEEPARRTPTEEVTGDFQPWLLRRIRFLRPLAS